MTVDALTLIHLSFTFLTVVGGLTLGIAKLRNKQHGRDEDKLDKIIQTMDKKMSDHCAVDEIKHKTMEDNISKLCASIRAQGETIAVLNERSQTEKELVNKLDGKLDNILERL